MSLDNAILKHADWKIKFGNALCNTLFRRESLDSYVLKTIKKDNYCELGKWLHGEGEDQYGGLPSYKAWLNKHAEFHAEAEKIAKVIEAKRYIEAYKMLNGDSTFNTIVNEISRELKLTTFSNHANKLR